MTHTTTLTEPTAARQTLDRLWTWLKPRLLAGHAYQLSIAEPRRSSEQNRKLHALITDIADRREWAGRRWDPLTWKRLLTAAWMRARGDQVLVVPALDGHGFDVVFEHTSRLSKAQMTELIEFIEAWDSTQGD